MLEECEHRQERRAQGSRQLDGLEREGGQGGADLAFLLVLRCVPREAVGVREVPERARPAE
eukprot:2415-Lingulodinium_polyedra.AAC.1